MPNPDSVGADAKWEELQKQLADLAINLAKVSEENAALRGELQAAKVHKDMSQSSDAVQAQVDAASAQSTIQPTTSTGLVCKISPKVPPFWHQKPEMWFAHIETQFRIAGITSDQTKFDHVIAQLDFKITAEIEDIVTDPPKTDKYNYLRKELIRRLSQSEQQRVRQLLSEEELGDRKPTQFLRNLRSLAGSTMKDEGILRQLFLRRLPQHAQAIVAAKSDPLDEIAAQADTILEVVPNVSIPTYNNSVHAAAAAPANVQVPGADPFGLQAFTTEIRRLTAEVAALSHHRDGSRSRYRSQSRNRTQSPAAKNYCWYHRSFGPKATRCASPCSWNQENRQSNQ